MSIAAQPPLSAAEKRARLARLLEDRASRPRQAPPSFAQQRLWFLDQLAPGNPAYHVSLAMLIAHPPTAGVLAAALGELVERHEVLRTTFTDADGAPAQVIAPTATPALAVIDLRALPGERHLAEARRLVTQRVHVPFDLGRGPLLRCDLIELGEPGSVVTLTLHHIIADGWSVDVLIEELIALCGAAADGRRSPLPALPLQYADFARWQRQALRGERLAAQSAYWQERLAGAAPLELPTDRPRPPVQSFRGGAVPVGVPPPLTRALRALGLAEGATLFMALLAAYQVLLHRYSGQADLSVGTPIAGRSRRELERLIGLFVNTLVLRVDLAGGPSFRTLLAAVRETVLGAFAHQEMPFEQLVEVLQGGRDPSRSPL